ncbi:MAG: hypothetical protein K1X78_27070 [Verrucomicrobiaceae bacterium]|nr:hypothetical protein [Verrucomicrobiaceae bacterium]
MPAKAELWTSGIAATVPATKVADIGQTPDFSSTADAPYTVTTATSPVLAAGTRYWIFVSNPNPGGGSFNWRNSFSAAIAASTFGVTLPSVRASSTNGGTSWSPFGTGNRQILSLTGNCIVTTTADSGTGSLRQALGDAADAANPGADTITFAADLSGQSIELSTNVPSAQGQTAVNVNDTGGVTIDASSLPGGILLTRPSGGTGDGYHAFYITSGSSLTLRGLTIASFKAGTNHGGAIFNNGSLTLERCTLTGNSTDYNGGAIHTPAQHELSF